MCTQPTAGCMLSGLFVVERVRTCTWIHVFFPLLSSSKRFASSFSLRGGFTRAWACLAKYEHTRLPVFARVHGRRRKVPRDIAAAIRPSFRELNFTGVPGNLSRPPSLPLRAISPSASVFARIPSSRGLRTILQLLFFSDFFLSWHWTARAFYASCFLPVEIWIERSCNYWEQRGLRRGNSTGLELWLWVSCDMSYFKDTIIFKNRRFRIRCTLYSTLYIHLYIFMQIRVSKLTSLKLISSD